MKAARLSRNSVLGMIIASVLLSASGASAADIVGDRVFITFNKAKDFFISSYASQQTTGNPQSGMSMQATQAGSINFLVYNQNNMVFNGTSPAGFTVSFPDMGAFPALKQTYDNCMALAATAGDTSPTSVIKQTRGFRVEMRAQTGKTILLNQQAMAVYPDPAKIAAFSCQL